MIKSILLLCPLFFLTIPAFSQSNGQIVSTTPIVYPAYEEIKDIFLYYEKTVYDNAVSDPGFRSEKLTYYSDSLKVIAFLCVPEPITKGKKYPVVIFNRGSYIRNDIAFIHAPLFRKFTSEGFIIIAPALRESEGSEGKDEMGGKDLNDIWNVLPLLHSLEYADTNNLFMYGESRGGMMTLQLLKRGFPVNAAATVGAITDFGLYVKNTPGIENFCRQIWPDYEEEKSELCRQRSAIEWADQINAPLLIMAGSNDRSVDPSESVLLAEKLKQLNKEHSLFIVEGGNHPLSGKWSDLRDSEILNWFKKYLSK